jgi:hypothetical protein
VINDDGQDAAVRHIEKKPNLLNKVKLSWGIEVKLKVVLKRKFEFLDLAHMFRNPTKWLIKMWIFRLHWISLRVEVSLKI